MSGDPGTHPAHRAIPCPAHLWWLRCDGVPGVHRWRAGSCSARSGAHGSRYLLGMGCVPWRPDRVGTSGASHSCHGIGRGSVAAVGCRAQAASAGPADSPAVSWAAPTDGLSVPWDELVDAARRWSGGPPLTAELRVRRASGIVVITIGRKRFSRPTLAGSFPMRRERREGDRRRLDQELSPGGRPPRSTVTLQKNPYRMPRRE